MTTVVFAMSGSVRRNSRALKQIQILSNCGFKIIVLDIKGELFPNPLIDNTEWHHLSISGSGPRFFRDVHRRFLRFAKDIQADVYHASDLYVLSAMKKLASSNGAKLVYDSRELYPHVSSTKNKPWSTLFWSRFEAKNIKPADLVFTVSDSIASALKNLYPNKSPIVLWNIPARPTDRVFERTVRDDLDLAADQPLILHIGQIKKSRGCDNLVKAMTDVHHKAHCAFLGGGPYKSELILMVNQTGLEERVHFLDPVPPEQLIQYISSASIGVSLLEDTCLNHRFALPNKLFEYLMAGLPVLTSDLPEISGIVKKYDVGQVTNSSSPDSIAKSLKSCLEDQPTLADYSRNTKSVFSEMNWDIATERFRNAYEALVSDKLA